MRIITGRAKGCRLKTPSGNNTRPTADRVKESVFNILGNLVRERCVLDVFAGTGNLGLEALSRGAVRAVFVDLATANLIRDNACRTKLGDQSQIFAGDARKILPKLERQGECFDLIFADPPYHTNLAVELLAFADKSALLAENGILVLEHGELNEPPWERLALVRRETYGAETRVSFYQRQSWLDQNKRTENE